MQTHGQTTGACPGCGTELHPAHVIITYERHGQPAAYAECPGCRAIVRPTHSPRWP